MKKAKPLRTQGLGFYVDAEGGGCYDVGVLQMKPGFKLYHDEQITQMQLNERLQFIPYMLSVLVVLGHPAEKTDGEA